MPRFIAYAHSRVARASLLLPEAAWLGASQSSVHTRSRLQVLDNRDGVIHLPAMLGHHGIRLALRRQAMFPPIAGLGRCDPHAITHASPLPSGCWQPDRQAIFGLIGVDGRFDATLYMPFRA